MTKGTVNTSALKILRQIGFPTTQWLIHLVLPHKLTPSPVLRDGQYDPDQIINALIVTYYHLQIIIIPFEPYPNYNQLVSSAFNPPLGVLFNIPSQY